MTTENGNKTEKGVKNANDLHPSTSYFLFIINISFHNNVKNPPHIFDSIRSV